MSTELNLLTLATVTDPEIELHSPTYSFANEPRSGSLNLLGTLSIAWRSIRANVLRSVLTTLGVIIGVAAVVALSSLGSAVTSDITNRLASLGTNLLTITSNFGRGGPPGLVRSNISQTVTLADAQLIRELDDPRIAGVAASLQTSTQVKAGENNYRASLVGTWSDYAGIRNSQVQSGSFFSDADNNSRRRVVVLGYEANKELFPQGDTLGQTVKIEGVSYTVIGVL